MSHMDLTLSTKDEVKVEPSYYGSVEVTLSNVDIDDIISEVGVGKLLTCMDVDDVITWFESNGYKVNEGE